MGKGPGSRVRPYFVMELFLRQELAQALRQAILECQKHNADYHHQTPAEMLDRWEKLAEMGEYEGA